MSNQPFTFPPPPPPPPKPTVDPTQQPINDFSGGRGGHRGWRGDSFRGQGHDRGGGRGSHRGGGRNHSQPYSQNTSSRPYNNNNYSRPTYSNPPQKRTHNTAFTPAPNARPRPLAPPPVPSFNATIPHLLPNKPPILTPPEPTPSSTQGTQTAKPPAKKNLLGLTPSLPDGSSSSEDEDEEHHLSTTINSASQGQGYSFTHNGRVATLRTAADIQAWIAERRKNFPTAAKAEAAKKEREEKKKKWMEEKEEQRRQREVKKVERQRKYEEEKQARQSARQAAMAEKQGAPIGAGSRGGGGISNAGPKDELVDSPAEKLRRRAEKAERALKRAEEALRQVRLKQAQAQAQAQTQVEGNGGDEADMSTLPAVPDTTIDPDATSSSGSSDSDTDSDSDSEIDGHLAISSSIGSHSNSDSESNPDDNDNDDDAAPETISTKDPSLLLQTNNHTQPSSFDADATKTLIRGSRPCKNLLQRGRCHFGSSCRYSHDLDQAQRNDEASRTRGRGGKTQKGRSGVAAKPERRKGLFQVMVDKEEEERRKNIIDAIFLLRERGMLDEPEQKTQSESVAEAIAQQPVEVSNST